MKKSISISPRFSVFNDWEEVFTTKNRELALAKVDTLMLEKTPKIILSDHKEEKATSWTKEKHQKNYRKQTVTYNVPEIVKEELINQ